MSTRRPGGGWRKTFGNFYAMWRDQIEPIVKAAGFNTEYSEALDLLNCTTPDEAYCITVFQRSGQWYVAQHTFFHLRQGTKLPELLAILFRERPGIGQARFQDDGGSVLPDSIRASFQLEAVPHEQVEQLIQPHLEGGLLHRCYLADKFGFRHCSAAEESRGMGLAEAKSLVEQARRHPITFDPERAAINDDLIYVPCTYIGCVGYLVERRSRRVMLLGSGMLPHVHIWAYYRGFWDCHGGMARVAGGRGEDTLLIRAVHDLEKTRESLFWFLRDNAAASELAKRLHNPPCLVREVALRPYIRAFMEAEEKGYFDFEINPKDAEPDASPNGGPAMRLGDSGVSGGPPSVS